MIEYKKHFDISVVAINTKKNCAQVALVLAQTQVGLKKTLLISPVTSCIVDSVFLLFIAWRYKVFLTDLTSCRIDACGDSHYIENIN